MNAALTRTATIHVHTEGDLPPDGAVVLFWPQDRERPLYGRFYTGETLPSTQPAFRVRSFGWHPATVQAWCLVPDWMVPEVNLADVPAHRPAPKDPTYRKGTVSLEGVEERFTALIEEGQTFGGFAAPWFTKAEFQRVADALDGHWAETPDGSVLVVLYDEDEVSHRTVDGVERYTVLGWTWLED